MGETTVEVPEWLCKLDSEIAEILFKCTTYPIGSSFGWNEQEGWGLRFYPLWVRQCGGLTYDKDYIPDVDSVMGLFDEPGDYNLRETSIVFDGQYAGQRVLVWLYWAPLEGSQPTTLGKKTAESN